MTYLDVVEQAAESQRTKAALPVEVTVLDRYEPMQRSIFASKPRGLAVVRLALAALAVAAALSIVAMLATVHAPGRPALSQASTADTSIAAP